MYISNYCDNGCVYCGYSHRSGIAREKLSLDDIEFEAKAIAETGLEQVLVLTGESKSCSPPSYIQAAVEKLVPIFSSVSVECILLRWRNIKVSRSWSGWNDDVPRDIQSDVVCAITSIWA